MNIVNKMPTGASFGTSDCATAYYNLVRQFEKKKNSRTDHFAVYDMKTVEWSVCGSFFKSSDLRVTHGPSPTNMPAEVCEKKITSSAYSILPYLQDDADFDLHFEKVYRWVASSPAEKNSFISCIWKLNQRYLRKKVEFVNVSAQLLEGVRWWCEIMWPCVVIKPHGMLSVSQNWLEVEVSET